MGKLINIVGKTFGRLRVDKRIEGMTNKRVYYECRCECGNEVIVRGESLNSGHTSSCGCLQKDIVKQLKSSHGLCGTPLYICWASMIQRCCNPNHKNYNNYGGRGIAVCDEWRNDFASFHNWASKNGYDHGLQLDRENNNKGYCGSNCRFVSRAVNNRNKRDNRIVTYNGESKSLVQHCEKLNLYYEVVSNRLNRNGWSIDKALGTPTNEPYNYKRPSRIKEM